MMAVVDGTAAIIARVKHAAGCHPPQGSGAIKIIGAVAGHGRPWVARGVDEAVAG